MGAYMQLTPDPESIPKTKQEISKDMPWITKSEQYGMFDHVRRPVRGTQIKGETFATLEIKTRDGQNLLLIDGGGTWESGGVGFTPKYSNFLLTSVSEQRAERSQIMETFGPSYIFFFGERPTVLNFSGTLINSADFNWKNEWWENYDRFLRGTQCVTYGTKAYITYDDVIKQGYILSSSASQSADPEMLADFSFQLIVSQHMDLSPVGSREFPTTPLFPADRDIIIDDSSDGSSQANIDGFQGTFKLFSDNDDEYIARSTNPIQKHQFRSQFERTSTLEDLVRKWFEDHGMEVPGAKSKFNQDNVAGSGISMKQILGWTGQAVFTSVNLAKEIKTGTEAKDKNAEKVIEDARGDGGLARIARLI